MAKKNDWSKAVTPQIKNNMEESARAAYANGCNLREDAVELFNAARYARSAALAILSEEEFSKAFILLICAGQNRWDSNIYWALLRHPEKQGIAEAMRDHFDWFIANYRRVMEMNRTAVLPIQPATVPGQDKLDELIAKAKSRFSKPVRDRLKQEAFYVSLDDEAKLKSTPASVTKEDAQQCLGESDKFKAVTEVLMGDASGTSKWVQL